MAQLFMCTPHTLHTHESHGPEEDNLARKGIPVLPTNGGCVPVTETQTLSAKGRGVLPNTDRSESHRDRSRDNFPFITASPPPLHERQDDNHSAITQLAAVNPPAATPSATSPERDGRDRTGTETERLNHRAVIKPVIAPRWTLPSSVLTDRKGYTSPASLSEDYISSVYGLYSVVRCAVDFYNILYILACAQDQQNRDPLREKRLHGAT
ncbi:hypothetical protein EYF80_012934 [Liparis tanakae]|uniref:Uncharacterized protein n=1 Tax=Liparis tanakae TaxID=230148 RepID=A0A4Z2IGN6_9TELE|nr:hypothetical protein EYF80_012934 [Liparis tanakae]